MSPRICGKKQYREQTIMTKNTITPPRTAFEFGNLPAASSGLPVPALNANMLTLIVGQGRDKEKFTVLDTTLNPRSKVVVALHSAGEKFIRLPNTNPRVFKLYILLINTSRVFARPVAPENDDILSLLGKLFSLSISSKIKPPRT